MQILRRFLLILSFLVLPYSLASAEEPILGDDGLYHQSWFLESFLELRDDIDQTAANGKTLAVFWELKGCPYCKETHFTNLARDDIREFIQKHFEVLQLNVLGSRVVTDVDGEEMSEKSLAQKYGVRFTPTIQFMDPDQSDAKNRKPKARELARMQGYLKPDHFLSMFKYVESGSHKDMSFRQYIKSQLQN